jgi:flagellar protein FliO/FliZ
MKFSALAAALLLLAGPLAAETTAVGGPGSVVYPAAAGTTPSAFARDAGGGGGFSPLAAIGIAALAGAGLWLWWRGRQGGAASFVGRSERRLVVAETRSLGNRQYLVVAAYDDKRFLLGVCPGRIEMLAPLEAAPPPRLP